MRQTIKYEFWVGLFLLLGIAALVFLGLRVANVQGFGETKSYTVTATFDNIGGLKVRAPLKLGGVVIGRVSDIVKSCSDCVRFCFTKTLHICYT